MIFALAGNQNCGKTTLFNQLTGSNQHVGNFPGVTVDQKMGEVRGEKNCSVVDLPGIYSIRPYTAEEIVTRDFILNEKPDGIINIVDATNIERNLYLTIQLLEMNVPMVIALKMMDEFTFDSYDCCVLNSVTNLGKIIAKAAEYETVKTFLDNDDAGLRAFSQLAQDLETTDVSISEMSGLYDGYKDLNEMLVKTRTHFNT